MRARSDFAPDCEAVLGPDGYSTKPRGEPHGRWNASSEQARIIEVISPAGFEDFFREVTWLVAAGSRDFGTISELAAGRGLTFEQPDWLPDVVTRYGFTPPPGL